jgi:acyl carrier protein
MADWTEESVLANLQVILEEVLDEDEIQLTRQSTALDIPNWDSLAHVEIMELVQRRFKVKFSLADLQKPKTVGDLVDLILTKSPK